MYVHTYVIVVKVYFFFHCPRPLANHVRCSIEWGGSSRSRNSFDRWKLEVSLKRNHSMQSSPPKKLEPFPAQSPRYSKSPATIRDPHGFHGGFNGGGPSHQVLPSSCAKVVRSKMRKELARGLGMITARGNFGAFRCPDLSSLESWEWNRKLGWSHKFDIRGQNETTKKIRDWSFLVLSI